jgi:hypothetical protein
MRERREHYIPAAYAAKGHDLTFPDMVRASKDEFLKNAVVNDNPPPEREVVLVVSVTRYEQLLTSSMERVVGFVFEDDLCLNNLTLKPEFLVALEGLLARVLSSNKNIRHYGVSAMLFVEDRSVDELKYVYGVLADLCAKASTDVNVAFDIIQDRQELRAFLKGQLRRIVRGDIKVQFEALRR